MFEWDLYIHDHITSMCKCDMNMFDSKKPVEKPTRLPNDIKLCDAVNTCDRKRQLGGITAFDPNGDWHTRRSAKCTLAFCKAMARDITSYPLVSN
eukprot:11676907-Heterocapsa_arctica.AAC.1